MLLLATSTATEITVSLAAAAVLIVLLVVLRIMFRKEPSPASWRRLRAGVFIERDPKDRDDQPPRA
jgi:hypothetical protein